MALRHCDAKINLALAVGPPIGTGEPGAGLHPICSWMCRVGLGDTLTLERAPQTRYRRRWADGSAINWPEDDDLAIRAHRRLETHLGTALPVEMGLTKSIPPGSGLGGGSSDAAGMLLALRELFELDVSIQTLRRLGAALGSDIPFFIDEASAPPPAIVSGLGERAERVAPIEAVVLLVLPPVRCQTGAVYRAFDSAPRDGDFEASSRAVADAARRGDTSSLFNDLRPAAEMVRPELAALREAIEHETGEPVHLSGSGSTLFLLNPRTDADAIARIAPGCRVVTTRTL